jgi:hypothetical protein
LPITIVLRAVWNLTLYAGVYQQMVMPRNTLGMMFIPGFEYRATATLGTTWRSFQTSLQSHQRKSNVETAQAENISQFSVCAYSQQTQR